MSRKLSQLIYMYYSSFFYSSNRMEIKFILGQNINWKKIAYVSSQPHSSTSMMYLTCFWAYARGASVHPFLNMLFSIFKQTMPNFIVWLFKVLSEGHFSTLCGLGGGFWLWSYSQLKSKNAVVEKTKTKWTPEIWWNRIHFHSPNFRASVNKMTVFICLLGGGQKNRQFSIFWRRKLYFWPE